MHKVVKQCLKVGDYVLATKYSDGDPGDHFCIGFFVGMTWDGRYDIADNNGKLFRGNGFRRVKKISRERGAWLVRRLAEIEQGCHSVWWWARRSMK